MRVGSWITQLRKGIAEYIVLLVLSEQEAYGYEILQALSQAKYLMLGESTVYPLLGRLARDGYLSVRVVNSQNGPRRRYYRLTHSGKNRLQEMNRYWGELTQSIQNVREGNYHE